MELDSFRDLLRAEGYSQSTIRTYASLVGQYLALGTAIDKASIVKYLSQLRASGCSDQKLRMAYFALARYYKYKTGQELGISPPKGASAPIEALTGSEIKRLISACAGNKRNKAIIEFLLHTGLRISELVNLRPEDINTKDGTVYVKYGKMKKHRKVPCKTSILREIKEFLPLNIKQRQIQRIIHHYAKKARINKKVTPHVLRHTYATILLRNGADIYYISRLLGHSSINRTVIYLEAKDSDLKRVYRECFKYA